MDNERRLTREIARLEKEIEKVKADRDQWRSGYLTQGKTSGEPNSFHEMAQIRKAALVERDEAIEHWHNLKDELEQSIKECESYRAKLMEIAARENEESNSLCSDDYDRGYECALRSCVDMAREALEKKNVLEK